MLQYQRPRASCEKLPDLIRPSIGRWRRPKDLSGVVVRRSIVLAARHDDQWTAKNQEAFRFIAEYRLLTYCNGRGMHRSLIHDWYLVRALS